MLPFIIITLQINVANTSQSINMLSLESVSLDALPAEVLLDIIPYIPFSPNSFKGLCLTCTRLHLLVKHHEHGIVRAIKRNQFSSLSLELFPDLATNNFHGLTILRSRIESLEDLHSQWLRITSNTPDLRWLKGRWENIHKAGLLLLYRLQDSGTYCNKVSILNGLPATSLACLVFKLISSIKILRIYGPDPIRETYQADDIAARSDIELAFEELLLIHGPRFFIAMLKAGEVCSQSSNSDARKETQWAVEYVPPSFLP